MNLDGRRRVRKRHRWESTLGGRPGSLAQVDFARGEGRTIPIILAATPCRVGAARLTRAFEVGGAAAGVQVVVASAARAALEQVFPDARERLGHAHVSLAHARRRAEFVCRAVDVVHTTIVGANEASAFVSFAHLRGAAHQVVARVVHARSDLTAFLAALARAALRRLTGRNGRRLRAWLDRNLGFIGRLQNRIGRAHDWTRWRGRGASRGSTRLHLRLDR